MTIYLLLLMLHIMAGTIAILSGLGGMYAIKGVDWHRFYGQIFVLAMAVIFLTAIPLSIIKYNLFLFLIAIFSFYQAWMGYRFATNRSGQALLADWFVMGFMLLTGLMMLGAGWYWRHHFQGIVLLVFGGLGLLGSLSDMRVFYHRQVQGATRIFKHLSSMIGALIATLTAFSVTNIHLQPVILVWLGPTALLVPVIVWWRFRTIKQYAKKSKTI